MRHVKYNSIKQFRNTIIDIKNRVRFEGFNDKGEPIFNYGKTMPVLDFKGTIKLHGTNAAVTYDTEHGIRVQARNRFISVGDDNYGFAAFVKRNTNEFTNLFKQAIDKYNINPTTHTIVIYGEWAGKGIQKGVGISELERSFYIFGLNKVNNDKNIELDSTILNSDSNLIHNINDFETYNITIDFNNPELSQNKLAELTNAVEKECPVTKQLGIENTVGEGIVWSTTFLDDVYRFKVKGDKHSSSKVKQLANVSTEDINSMIEFAKYSVTESRVEQALKEVFGEEEYDINKYGSIIKWIIEDIFKEESDVLADNNIDTKLVGRYLAKEIKQMLINVKFLYSSK